jgi:hypothetical protein
MLVREGPESPEAGEMGCADHGVALGSVCEPADVGRKKIKK